MKRSIILTILLAAVPCSAAIITVEPDGSGGQPTIQDAVDIAAGGDEIVLAIGIYTGGGNRDIDFGSKSITVRSTNPNDPNTVAATIIDCQGTESNPHRGFSFISGEGANSIVSGLTVTNGYGPDEEISGYVRSVGGAIYCYSSSPTVTNCTFGGNSAGSGGGMYNYDNSNPTVTNCTFSDNSTEYSGGGMLNVYNSSPTVTNCTFTDNLSESGGGGGGMFNYEGSSPTVTNCTFTGNSAYRYGGGMLNVYNSSPTVTNCTFTGNSADYEGGGMYNRGGDGGGDHYPMPPYYSSPMVTNCTFTGNSAEWSGGGMVNYDSRATVTNCTFTDNSANHAEWGVGGGMANSRSWSIPLYYCRPMITNCTFTGNTAVNYGGGMSDWESTVINCTFTGNTAAYGGGMVNWISATVTNCTFGGNLAGDDGGGMYNWDDSSPTVTNCILWANSPEQVYSEERSSPVITYSDIQGGWEGEGNININPNFVDPDGPDGVIGTEDDNLHLIAGSPCIDAGDNTAVTELTDLDGHTRIVDGDCDGTATVDMGAYEFDWLYIGDLAGGCDINLEDFAVLAESFGQDDPAIDIAPYPAADGIIDFKELLILAEHWLEDTLCACSEDIDCGTDGFVGDIYCYIGNCYQDYITFECLNPGTSEAECVSESTSTLIETCSIGCAGGECVEEEDIVYIDGPAYLEEPLILNQPNTYYRLSGDLTTSGDCIIIEADGITLDLNGYTLTGTGPPITYGVSASVDYCGVTLKNGTITGFTFPFDFPCGGSFIKNIIA